MSHWEGKSAAASLLQWVLQGVGGFWPVILGDTVLVFRWVGWIVRQFAGVVREHLYKVSVDTQTTHILLIKRATTNSFRPSEQRGDANLNINERAMIRGLMS